MSAPPRFEDFSPTGKPVAVVYSSYSSYGSGIPDVCRAVSCNEVAREVAEKLNEFGFWRVKGGEA